MRSGLVAAIASTNDLNGAKPRYGQIWPTARVLPSGWRGGQTASTVKPACARATASRAVGNLDFFVRLQVIPHQHLLFAANQRGADLDRRQPVHIDVGNNLVRKIEGHESHVFETVEVSLPSGHDGLRSLLDQVIHDRQVMRGEVADYIDVVLEQAKVHPRGIVVVQFADRLLFY